MGERVVIDIDREGCCPPGSGYQISIGTRDEAGYGTGYRIDGPKYCALGKQEHVTSAELDEDAARNVFGYIRPLLGEEWLSERTGADRLRVAVGEAHAALRDAFGHADAPYTPQALEALTILADALDDKHEGAER